MEYAFREQLKVGHEGEKLLDEHFSKTFTITEATDEEQRQGFDRWFETSDGRKRKVEYKTCSWAARTDRILVETVSVDKDGKQGWIWTTTADWVLYHSEGDHQVYWFKPQDVRDKMHELMKKTNESGSGYILKAFTNKGYHTVGLLVPRDEFIEMFVDTVDVI